MHYCLCSSHILMRFSLTVVGNVKWDATAGKQGSPLQSSGWSSLYWGVEYKSRQTGPFSVVTKSKDVPFSVGSGCRSSQCMNHNMWKSGAKDGTAVCPTKANRKLLLTKNTCKLFFVNRIGSLLDSVSMLACTVITLWLCRAAHRGFFYFSHFTFLDLTPHNQPD